MYQQASWQLSMESDRISTVSGVPRNSVRGGGFQQIQMRTEGRENGDLGATDLGAAAP